MRYFKKIEGERVYLSPMRVEDAEMYTKWMNDPEVSTYLGQYDNMVSLENERAYIESAVKDGHNYAIVLNDGDQLIGNISLMNINHRHRRATLGLFIGEAEHRSKGYGTEAVRLIVNYGFKTLNLSNIMLMVFSPNKRAIACYEKVGFKEFGRRTKCAFIDGEYVDDVYMEILNI